MGRLPSMQPGAVGPRSRSPGEPMPPADYPEASEALADLALADAVALALAAAVAWLLQATATLGATPADPEARAARRGMYTRGARRWMGAQTLSPQIPGSRPDGAAPEATRPSPAAGQPRPALRPAWWLSRPRARRDAAAGDPAPPAEPPAPPGPPTTPPGPAAAASAPSRPEPPDFPPVAGAVAAPHEAPLLRYGLPVLLLALTAWLYIHSVWPGVARGGGFDHNAWEAAALLHGHVHTPPPPDGATLDMMHLGQVWASFFPPLPAFLLMPLVWYFHNPLRTPVRLFCALLGTLSPLLVYQMGERAGLRPGPRLWIACLFAFGTVFWYSVDTGSPWYYVQVATVFFYLLALRESFGRNRPILVGTLFGAALLCRNTVALGVLFLFWREPLWPARRIDWRRIAGFCVPVAIAVAIQFWWNWARTGNPLDTGYAHILMGSGFKAAFSQGMFSYKHIPWQIYSIFFQAPAFHGQANFNGVWPYLRLSGTGQSLLLTTPAFLYALEGDVRRRRVWLGLLAVALTMIPQLLYYANGTGQFGNRFSLDYTPLLLALLLFGIGRRFRWQHAALILASIFLSGYGAVYAAHVHLVSPPHSVHASAPAPAPAPSSGCLKLAWMARCP